MSLEYRVTSLESAVQICKSEIKAVEDRARERRDYWLSAIFWTLCGFWAFLNLVLILAPLLKAHSN
jgi:uncharacterized membrane protein YhaH (DUF805 family)